MNSKIILSTILVLLFSISFASAVVVSDVSQGRLFPGDQTALSIELKNTLDDDVEDVSFNLDFGNVQFISIGGSEKSFDEIRDGRTKSFTINVKAFQDIKPGDYNIPYTISFIDKDDNRVEKIGSIGIIVGAKTELDFDVELEKNVIGESGKLELKIVNRGFGEVKFVNVEISGQGFTILGTNTDYIGNVESDDFETASFNVIFDELESQVVATVTYKDFDNNQQVESYTQRLQIYSKKEGIELGIIERNNTFIYVILVLTVILLWILYRVWRKKRKKINRK
jgi:hypothetical protein